MLQPTMVFCMQWVATMLLLPITVHDSLIVSKGKGAKGYVLANFEASPPGVLPNSSLVKIFDGLL